MLPVFHSRFAPATAQGRVLREAQGAGRFLKLPCISPLCNAQFFTDFSRVSLVRVSAGLLYRKQSGQMRGSDVPTPATLSRDDLVDFSAPKFMIPRRCICYDRSLLAFCGWDPKIANRAPNEHAGIRSRDGSVHYVSKEVLQRLVTRGILSVTSDRRERMQARAISTRRAP